MMDAATPEEEMKLLEIRLNQLKLDYEKYFLGTRPTEPAMQRAEIQKFVLKWSNTRITNTALRFKFNSLNGRFQAFKRQWDNTLRQIEAGTYKRHVFKADLHDRERALASDSGASAPRRGGAGAPSGGEEPDLFETYRDAMLATGQDTSKLSRQKLQRALAKQEAALKKKFGCEKVDFKVVVKGGKVKVSAAAG
ncbi:MAG: hypothetical protein JRG86_06610 [Deltaproteobacteria bacterium]|jgi:hypothetical protein|nr:hypothetical protein [Deltaproteobacteria bacterium]MBW2499911.1 hypothetical protein [Deltaproteobacteria bacterium]